MDGKDEHKSCKAGVGSTPIPRQGAETRVCRNGLFVFHRALSFTPLVLHLREILRKTSLPFLRSWALHGMLEKE